MGEVTIYGIANCDTVKKARKWLDSNAIEYRFHDYRKQGLDVEQLQRWEARLGWESLLNRRGTTWRKLAEDVKKNINRDSAIEIMLENPAIIKRPLMISDNKMMLGFSDAEYQAFFS